jgi:hypothetical protein
MMPHTAGKTVAMYFGQPVVNVGTVVERASEEPIRDAGDEGTDLALWQAQAPLRFEGAVKPSEQIDSRPV